jgi:sodium-dependent phosphate cotransporter
VEAAVQDPPDLDATLPPGELEAGYAERTKGTIPALWARVDVGKILLFAASLYLFILALLMMKEGAEGLAPLVRNGFRVTNPVNSLGFGWLFAYLVMSGSPVAAAALTFFDAGVIDQLETFTMITGSRLGASFIVLFIGFIYVLRGRNRVASLSMGQMRSASGLTSAMDALFAPIVEMLARFLPQWALFVLGMAIILVSFNLFDRCLPQMAIKESQVGRVSRLVYRPWVMLLLGAAVTLVSMSVSVSLSILVPLSNRGFIRRENVIPYILGANITTFIDTLIAAVLLNNPPAFTVVMTEMISIAIVSLVILVLVYRPFEHLTLAFVGYVTESNRGLVLFMVAIFITPLLLLLI